MTKAFLTCILVATFSARAFLSPVAPPPEAFRVFKQTPAPGPRITPYLKYQTEQAWSEDELRRREWEGIRNEKDVFQLQRELRRKLLEMIGAGIGLCCLKNKYQKMLYLILFSKLPKILQVVII